MLLLSAKLNKIALKVFDLFLGSQEGRVSLINTPGEPLVSNVDFLELRSQQTSVFLTVFHSGDHALTLAEPLLCQCAIVLTLHSSRLLGQHDLVDVASEPGQLFLKFRLLLLELLNEIALALGIAHKLRVLCDVAVE